MNLSDSMDDPSIHCLEASAPTTGGLVIKKDSKSGVFKIPKPSLLGLDTLAATKRREREEAKRLISFKDSEYDDTEGSPSTSNRDPGFKTPDVSSHHKLNRQYRAGKVETPSHTGGVSDKARHRLLEHAAEKDKRGVYISSKDKRKHDRDNDRHRSYNRDRDRHRHRERSDRRRSRSAGRDGASLRRERSSDSERSLHTPRFRDEPKTPKGNIIVF